MGCDVDHTVCNPLTFRSRINPIDNHFEVEIHVINFRCNHLDNTVRIGNCSRLGGCDDNHFVGCGDKTQYVLGDPGARIDDNNIDIGKRVHFVNKFIAFRFTHVCNLRKSGSADNQLNTVVGVDNNFRQFLLLLNNMI